MESSFISAIEAENKAKITMLRLKKDILKDVSAVKNEDVGASPTGVFVVASWDKAMEKKSLKLVDDSPREQVAAVRSVLDQCRYASDMLHAVSKMARSGLAVTDEGACKLTPGTRAVLQRQLIHGANVLKVH